MKKLYGCNLSTDAADSSLVKLCAGSTSTPPPQVNSLHHSTFLFSALFFSSSIYIYDCLLFFFIDLSRSKGREAMVRHSSVSGQEWCGGGASRWWGGGRAVEMRASWRPRLKKNVVWCIRFS